MPTPLRKEQRWALPSGRFVRIVGVDDDIVHCAYIADRGDPFAPKDAEPGVHFMAEALQRIATKIGAPHA